jgi:hypothetical protein
MLDDHPHGLCLHHFRSGYPIVPIRIPASGAVFWGHVLLPSLDRPDMTASGILALPGCYRRPHILIIVQVRIIFKLFEENS